MTEMKKKDLSYEEAKSILDNDTSNVRINVKIGDASNKSSYASSNKREVLKRDLLGREDILDVKIVAPSSNVSKLGLDSCLHTIESFNVAEEIVEKKGTLRRMESLTGLKYFAVKSHPVDSLAKENIEGEDYVRVNQDILLKKDMSSEPKQLDKIFFADREDAVLVASVATEVELEKAEAIIREAKKIAEFLEDQRKNERF